MKRDVANTVLQCLEKCPDATVTISATGGTELSPSEVAASAIELQIKYIHITRHIVALTGNILLQKKLWSLIA